MAGAGAGEGLTDSVLETPVYVLAVIFLLFMALSLAFEWALHLLRGACARRGRPGLAAAVEKSVMELTMLGFVSLLLQTFSSPLGRMCVGYSSSMEGWTWLSNLQGCPCCLENTAGVSLCAEMAHGCLFNVTTRQPFCGCATTGSPAYDSGAAYGDLMEAGQLDESCQPFELGEVRYYIDMSTNSLRVLADVLELSPGELYQLLGDNVSEAGTGLGTAVDDAYFDPEEDWFARRRLLAGGGGGGGGDAGGTDSNPLAVILANLAKPLNESGAGATSYHILPRIKLFKCTGSFASSACPPGQVPLISPNSLHQVHIWLFLIATFHVAVSVFQLAGAELMVRLLWRRWEAAAVAEEAAAAARAAAGDAEADAGAGSGSKDSGGSLDGSGAGADMEQGDDAAGGATGEQQVQPAEGRWAAARRELAARWRFRPEGPLSVAGWALEAAFCLLQALSPFIVTRHEFEVTRLAWLAVQQPAAQPPLPDGAPGSKHAGGQGLPAEGRPASGLQQAGQPPQPQFVSCVLGWLDAAVPAFVGLSVEMALVIVCLMLLTGAVGWAGALIIVLAAAALWATNLTLVALLRRSCRGGRPHVARARLRRLPSPRLLLGVPIRLLLFLASFVFSTTAFMAWQFGTRSCFFSTEGDPWGLWSAEYWSALVTASVFLLWLSAATVPAFALAVHTTQGYARQWPSWAGAAPGHGGAAGAAAQPAAVEGSSHAVAAAAAAAVAAPATAPGLLCEAARLRAELAAVEAQLAALPAAPGGLGGGQPAAA